MAGRQEGIPRDHCNRVNNCNQIRWFVKYYFIEEHNRGFFVNKTEMIDAIAAAADLPKASAARALDAVIDSITQALKQNEQVTLVGFGTFAVKERAARTGRNPKTGESIEIKASRQPGFKPGKALKDALT